MQVSAFIDRNEFSSLSPLYLFNYTKISMFLTNKQLILPMIETHAWAS